MKKNEEQTGDGQKPDFIEEIEDGYFFDIYTEISTEENAVQYSTKWSSNPKDVQKIAEHFNLSFVLEYEEFGNELFGKIKYNAKTKKMITNEITQEDWSEIIFDDDNDVFKFRGEEDETERNFLEQLYEERYNEAY